MCVCACIWFWVKCSISVSFSWWIMLFTARCLYFMSPKVYSSLCALMPPKVNCAIYSAQLVYVCACIWSRVKCPILVSFSRWILLFTARCVHFLPPKVNCAVCSPQLVYVCMCVCLHLILGQMLNFGSFSWWIMLFTAHCLYFMFSKVNCAIYSAWLVYVCVCVHTI